MEYIESLKTMQVGDLITQIILVVGVISAFVEKSKKLPFNPWSKLFEWVGSKSNKPLFERLDRVEKQNETTQLNIEDLRNDYKESIRDIREDYNKRIDGLVKSIDEKEAKRLRANIVCFSDACRCETKHTKQHFENIFRDYDDYLEYCEIHKIKNNYIEGEIAYIKAVYQERLKDNEFL